VEGDDPNTFTLSNLIDILKKQNSPFSEHLLTSPHLLHINQGPILLYYA